ncbi:MAG: peptide chain release factor N(5)-glutamine methyltransferase [Planctomycetales bacterium]
MTVESQKPAAGSGDVWTVSRILEWTTQHLKQHGSPNPRLDAEVLLAHARGCKRIKLYTDFDQPLTDAQRTVMRDLVKRRAQAEPVAYLIGRKEFYSLDFTVNSAVLIPRPETETLVMELIERARSANAPRILDLGTGSGCIAITTAVHLPTAQVTAVDISPDARQVAIGNAENHKVSDRVRCLEGDLYAPLTAGEQFDFVVSNPPYIPQAEMPALMADVRKHEPALALDGGAAGLEVITRLIAGASSRIVPGGWILLEIDPPQSAAVQQMLSQSGDFEKIQPVKDLAGEHRVIVGQRTIHP